jgi:hypothetical protein
MSVNWTQLLIDATTSTTSWMAPSTEEVVAVAKLGSYYGPLQSGIMKSTDLNYVDISYPTAKSAPYLSERGFFSNSILVGYHLQIIEGDYSSSDCNQILPDDSKSLFQQTVLVYRRAGRPLMDRAPGTIVYEDSILVAPSDADFSRPDKLLSQSTLKIRVDIPSGVLVEGTRYTARTRCILAFPYVSGDGYEPRWYVYGNGARPYFTNWGISKASVNSKPSVVNLTVNGLSNATRLVSTSGVLMGFSVKNQDGPKARYRVQVGSVTYGQFVPSMWDSNWVILTDGIGTVDVSIPYQGRALKTGVAYSWRVRSNDGLADGDWSDTKTFSINDPARIRSLKVGGTEVLFGRVPKAPADGAVVTWVYYDKESVGQKYYKLFYRQDDWGNEKETSAKSDITTVTLPEVEAGRQVFLRLVVSDGIEETTASGSFISNTAASITRILIEGQENPVTITTATPTLAWVYQDIDSEAQAGYQLQVSDEPEFNTLMWDTGQQMSPVNSVVYGSFGSPTPLVHGTYFVRMSVYDGVSWSDFSGSVAAFFAYNQAPTSPVIVQPASGTYSGAIEVRWLPATDPDGDELTYQIEVTNQRSSNRGWTLLVGPLPSTQTSYWIGAADLPSGDDYGIRVIASDGMANSDPTLGSTSQKFFIANHAPTTPVFATPTSGQVVRQSMRVEWIEADPVDVDGDVAYYILEITDDASSSSPTWRHLGTFGAGTKSYVFNTSEYDNGNDYQFRITAYDEHGLTGDVNLSAKFVIDVTSIANDVVFLDGTTFLTTSDGRILRVRNASWQVDEDWSGERSPRDFELFMTSGGSFQVVDGELRFTSPFGQTTIMREGE